MTKSNLNAFDDWAESNKIFVRGDDPERIANAYVTWWQATAGRQLTARQHPDTRFADLTWGQGIVAPAYRGFVTLITEAALLSYDQVFKLGEHLSRTLETLAVAAPHAAEEAAFGYSIYECGRKAFGQEGGDVNGEMQVKTEGAAWLSSKNIIQAGSGPAAWVFEDICQAIDLRAWEFPTDEKHTYYRVDEQ
jgi:hypothetical protein